MGDHAMRAAATFLPSVWEMLPDKQTPSLNLKLGALITVHMEVSVYEVLYFKRKAKVELLGWTILPFLRSTMPILYSFRRCPYAIAAMSLASGVNYELRSKFER